VALRLLPSPVCLHVGWSCALTLARAPSGVATRLQAKRCLSVNLSHRLFKVSFFYRSEGKIPCYFQSQQATNLKPNYCKCTAMEETLEYGTYIRSGQRTLTLNPSFGCNDLVLQSNLCWGSSSRPDAAPFLTPGFQRRGHQRAGRWHPLSHRRTRPCRRPPTGLDQWSNRGATPQEPKERLGFVVAQRIDGSYPSN